MKIFEPLSSPFEAEIKVQVRSDEFTSSSIDKSNKLKELSPREKDDRRNKKSATLEQTINPKIDNFPSKFESICGQMASLYGVAINACINANKFNLLSDEKMQEIVNELLKVGLP